MTKTKIKEIKKQAKKANKLSTKIEKIQKKETHAWHKLAQLNAKCDHKYPNGDLATENVMHLIYCTICGEMW